MATELVTKFAPYVDEQFSAESKGKIESPDMRSISGRWVRVLHPGHLLAEGS